MGWDLVIKDLTTFGVLFFLFLIFYSKFKKQSMKDSLNEIKENFQDIVEDGGEEVQAKIPLG